MINANFNTYNNYVTDSLYQWDLNQDLIINGLNLSVAPEIHFANANMDRAIVRQSTLSSGVVTVRIPNSLLQEALTIKAYVGVYENKTFTVIETIEIPLIAKARPSDYALTDSDEEIYSFIRLENEIANAEKNMERSIEKKTETLSAQLANVVAHNNDTEGNTELIDIRVDHEGSTHGSAGDAVRYQTSKLSEGVGELKDDLSNHVIELNNYFMDSPHVIGDDYTWTVGGFDYNTFEPNDVTDCIRINSYLNMEGVTKIRFEYTSYINRLRVVQYDEKKNVISGETKGDSDHTYVDFQINSETKYARVALINNNGETPTLEGMSISYEKTLPLSERVAAIQRDNDFVKQFLQIDPSKYFDFSNSELWKRGHLEYNTGIEESGTNLITNTFFRTENDIVVFCNVSNVRVRIVEYDDNYNFIRRNEFGQSSSQKLFKTSNIIRLEVMDLSTSDLGEIKIYSLPSLCPTSKDIDSVLTSRTSPLETIWEKGSLSYGGGVDLNNSGMIRSYVIKVKNGDLLHLKFNSALMRVRLFFYTLNDNVLTFLKQEDYPYVMSGYEHLEREYDINADDSYVRVQLWYIGDSPEATVEDSEKIELSINRENSIKKGICFGLTTEEYIMDKSVSVSDCFKYTVGDGAHISFDEKRGIAYVLYNTSKTSYGESHDIIALSVFPIKQPWRAEHYEIITRGSTIDGYYISETRDANILMLEDSVRIFFDCLVNTEGTWCYVDFDKNTKQIGNLNIITAYGDGVSGNLSFNTMRTFLSHKGYTPRTADAADSNWWPNICANLKNENGTIYTVIANGQNEYPVLASSDDNGASWILINVIPQYTEWEGSCALVGTRIYILLRPTDSTSEEAKRMWYTDDYGDTFNYFEFYPTSTTRPILLSYKDNLLVCHSDIQYIEPTYCLRTRNNLHLRLGTGTIKENYPSKLDFLNKYGILYYSIKEYKGQLYMVYCTGDLFHDLSEGCKDVIQFVKIGEIFTDDTALVVN